MANLKAAYRIEYEGKDITRDIQDDLLSLSYTDRVDGASDALEIKLKDERGKWRAAWYPKKGDKIKAMIGYEGQLVNCGIFELDTPSYAGPPDVITLRALAAGPGKSVRTSRYFAYEKQTLKQIAQAVAARSKLKLQGVIDSISLERVTQDNETDLAFLARLAAEYGLVFNLRGDLLVFSSVFELEDAPARLTLKRSDLSSYSFEDEMVGIYSACEVSYHVPKTKKTERHMVKVTDASVTSGDVLKINVRAENRQQAEAKAKAALHRANSKALTGEIGLEGEPRLLAGGNLNLKDMGVFSLKWHILESTHTITRDGGYSARASIKAV